MPAELDKLLAQRLSQHNTYSLTPAAQAVLRRLLSGSSFIHRTLMQHPALLAEFTNPTQLSGTLQQQADIQRLARRHGGGRGDQARSQVIGA